MLLQTNSYIVPRDKRVEHARLLRRFRQTLLRLGCDHFEVYEQTGANWSSGDTSGRFVQIMRFRDRKQQLSVQNAERADPAAQALLKEFCDLINLPYQQQQGLFAAGFYTSFMRMPEFRPHVPASSDQPQPELTDQNGAPTDGENLMAVAETSSTGNGDSNPEPTNDAEVEAAADPQSAYQSDDESDYSEPGEIPALPADQGEQSESQDEQAENPTSPSSS